MRRITILCVIITMWLCACGNNVEDVNTYAGLNSDQQMIIDNIHENYSTWESVYDSGRDIEVSKINFLYEEEVLLFVTYYDEGNDGVGYFYKIMEVDEDGNLTGHNYENSLFDKEEKANERAAMMAAITGLEYPLSDIEEQKNVLATALYNAQ